MKKKRFYDNKKRNQKWTEEVQGREIDFADKYLYNGDYSDKYDYKRPKNKTKKHSKVEVLKFLKKLVVVVLCFGVISVGYTLMDFYMQRVSYKYEQDTSEEIIDNSSTISQKETAFACYYTDGVYFDNSTMLQSVKSSISSGGFNSVCVDVKRNNGTVAYGSSLATVQSYNAISSAASDFKGSLANLKADKITVVARIFCYEDSVVPSLNTSDVIIGSDGEPYIDSNGSTWLNPQSKETYEYIKNIIDEVHSMGVNYFILDGVNMPEELKDKYSSSFADLSKKLYGDLGYDIKFIEPLDATVGEDVSNSDILELKDINQGSNQILMISTSAKSKDVIKKLQSSKMTNYVILQ